MCCHPVQEVKQGRLVGQITPERLIGAVASPELGRLRLFAHHRSVFSLPLDLPVGQSPCLPPRVKRPTAELSGLEAVMTAERLARPARPASSWPGTPNTPRKNVWFPRPPKNLITVADSGRSTAGSTRVVSILLSAARHTRDPFVWTKTADEILKKANRPTAGLWLTGHDVLGGNRGRLQVSADNVEVVDPRHDTHSFSGTTGHCCSGTTGSSLRCSRL